MAGERIRDKFAASRRKGMWMGGTIPLGYDVKDRKLVINDEEADRVRLIFQQYLAFGCVAKLQADLDQRGVRSKQRVLTETRTAVRDTVERVVVQRGQLHIIRKPTSATAARDEDDTAPQVHVAPLSAPRPGARKEIIVPAGHNSSPRRLNHALVLAIARAKSWMRELRSGRYADTTTIARQFQLNHAHVRRILRFGYLAPDIVEAIPSFTARGFYRILPPPNPHPLTRG